MKLKLYLLTSLLSLTLNSASAAQIASVRLYCLSADVRHGVDQYGDTIDFNYTGLTEDTNEFAPWWPTTGMYYDITLPDFDNHGSGLTIYDGFEKYSCWGGSLTVSIPQTDANGNRFPDFFEVARGINYTTSGTYYFYDWKYGFSDYGQVSSAVWTRNPGSVSGSYAFTFYDQSLSDPYYWGTFRGTFRILEYTGTLTYTPGSNVVSGTINLVQTGDPTHTWQGPISFTKLDSDRFNSLTNQPGIWTDAHGLSCNFTNHYFFRDPAYPTNYAGYIEFDDDADVSTIHPWATWVLSITDTNDVNHDGIPDFSDDPSLLPPPRRPYISLARNSTNLLFTIHGDVNHLHQIQQCPAINSSNWQNLTSVSLTNDPQVVPVAFPAGRTFYRVVAQ